MAAVFGDSQAHLGVCGARCYDRSGTVAVAVLPGFSALRFFEGICPAISGLVSSLPSVQLEMRDFRFQCRLSAAKD